MHSSDVIKLVRERLGSPGVPKHLATVRKVPCFVEINVLIGNEWCKVRLRSGITPPELDFKLTEVENAWRLKRAGQVDLEEAIEEAKTDDSRQTAGDRALGCS